MISIRKAAIIVVSYLATVAAMWGCIRVLENVGKTQTVSTSQAVTSEHPASAPAAPAIEESFLSEYLAEAGVAGAIGTLIVAGIMVWTRRRRAVK